MEQKKLTAMPNDLVYSLDIGTRNVVGTLARLNGQHYEIMDYEMVPHPDRAMFDGQIHDIEKVTQVVKNVSEQLENRNGFKLEKAAIAAAGRALKTEKASIERDVDFTKEITKNITDTLEMEAIQVAQKQLMSDVKIQSSYYCVGYSVIQYSLDGAMILNPIGHKGSILKVEIIATFLPHIVVDSLYAVLGKAGLEVMNMTLEPIAAMNVTIPQKLRLLNLALVDVGAGTSDIAISRDGTVESYGMVAVAGDEITEKLAQEYLLDFQTAESLKVNLNKLDTHSFNDIMGMSYNKTTAEIMNEIGPIVNDIAGHVAANIIQLNKKPPSAVFCIGGGAQIPGFTEAMAEALGLPKERVAIKSVEQLENVTFLSKPLKGPEFITPVGIGVTAFSEREQDFIGVSVNDNILRLFKSKTLHVSDALIVAGISARSLLAERGDAIEIVLDGINRKLRGEFGEPAKIYVNGMMASLDSKINHKDQITIEPATKGSVSKTTLGKLVNYDAVAYFRGQTIKLIDYVNVNGVNRTGDYLLLSGDIVVTRGISNVKTLCKLLELNIGEVVFLVNGKRAKPETLLNNGDIVDYEIMPSGYSETGYEDEDGEGLESNAFKLKDVVEDDQNFQRIRDDFNEPVRKAEEPIFVLPEDPTIKVEDETTLLGPITLLVNGNQVHIPKRSKPMVFVDIFNHIDFDISEAKGIIVLKLNDERARYTDILRDGDIIEISWKK